MNRTYLFGPPGGGGRPGAGSVPRARAGLGRSLLGSAGLSLLALAMVACGAAGASTAASHPASHSPKATASAAPAGILGGLQKLSTVASTVPSNGDVNPYALVVAPVSTGALVAGDVLVDNFNDKANDQGTGSTIVEVSPGGSVKLFAQLPRNLSGCPGGIGLDTAIAVLKTGWVIVGSAPSANGNSSTAGAGCLVVLNSEGQVASTITGADLDGPWDMADIDDGATATLFVDNVLFGVGSPGQAVLEQGTVVRIGLAVPASGPPTVTSETVIGSGFPEQASAGAFVIGPTGLALGQNGTLYVADRVANRIDAIADAATRTTSAGTGTILTSGGMLAGPLGMIEAPNGDLVVCNATNGKAIEIAPSGDQIASTWLDQDQAQSPAGSGDLFGIAVDPSTDYLYFVKDDNNTLDLLH